MLKYVKLIWNKIKTKLLLPSTNLPSTKSKITTYLAGPMEYTPDNGLGWRVEYAKDLKKLGIQSVIPNFEEDEIVPNVEQFNRDKQINLGRYINTMRLIIEKDLEFVKTVNFIITKWEGERISGTIGEAQYAYLRGQPNYLVTLKPFHEVPGWFLACFTELFHSKDELLTFLRSEYIA